MTKKLSALVGKIPSQWANTLTKTQVTLTDIFSGFRAGKFAFPVACRLQVTLAVCLTIDALACKSILTPDRFHRRKGETGLKIHLAYMILQATENVQKMLKYKKLEKIRRDF